MSTVTTNPTRTNHRARRVGEAVISAYIHELAAPAAARSAVATVAAAPSPATPVGESRGAGARRRGDCQPRPFPRPRHALLPATT